MHAEGSRGAAPHEEATSTRLRAGILGAGFIGSIHAKAVRAAGADVVLVADRSVDDSRRAAEAMQTRAAVSAEDLIESDDVDVVHICTPNFLHAPLAERAIRAGKHVVCEKPLGVTVDEARRLADLAGAADVVTAVPFVYRFYPTVREVRARIAAREAGPLWLLQGSYLQDWLSSASDVNWRVDPARGGASRAFADIGVHWCDLMEFTTGQRITRVSAVLGNAFQQRCGHDGVPYAGTEDGAAVLFETDGGSIGSVLVSQVSPGMKNQLTFSFSGTEASYRFDQQSPDTLWVGGRTHNAVVMRGPDTLSPEAGRLVTTPAGHPQGYQDSFNGFVDDVYSAVAGGTPDGLPTFFDGLRAAELTDAVVRSAATRQWVAVPAYREDDRRRPHAGDHLRLTAEQVQGGPR